MAIIVVGASSPVRQYLLGQSPEPD
jgi:hypothetical protein